MDRPPTFLPRPAAGGGGPGLFQPGAPQQQTEQQGLQELAHGGTGGPPSPFDRPATNLPPPPPGRRLPQLPPGGAAFMPRTNPLYGSGSPANRTPEGAAAAPAPKRFDLENAGEAA